MHVNAADIDAAGELQKPVECRALLNWQTAT
jgi:hypothetical protein